MAMTLRTCSILLVGFLALNGCGGSSESAHTSGKATTLSTVNKNIAIAPPVQSTNAAAKTGSQQTGELTTATTTDVVVEPTATTIVAIDPFTSAPITDRAARRFLEQLSFGPSEPDVARVQELGYDAYIDDQFKKVMSDFSLPDGASKTDLHQKFLYNALFGKDQLRQKMAYALGQIFVMSSADVGVKAIESFHSMLMANAFNSYERVLREVTLHPAMGSYLDMVNASGKNPNENYAREVMQLFSIGTVRIRLDGTRVLDAQGNPVPTYTQRDVEELARVLTGWTYPTAEGKTLGWYNPAHFIGRMEPNEPYHDHDAKIILGGRRLPAGQTAEEDLAAALKAIASHPNVASFISYRLIQQFVSSNPSPSYVRRVALVFSDDGKGSRGNLKAVIKAILLDKEARRGDDPREARPTGGKLKAPIFVVAGLLRSLDISGPLEYMFQQVDSMGQPMFKPPNVFGFFPPDVSLPDSELFSPEFNIYTNPNIVARLNFVSRLLYASWKGATIDLSAWTELAPFPTLLVDAVNRTLLHGAMTNDMRDIITEAVEALPPSDPVSRAQMAIYLTATAPQYLVQH